MGECPFCRPAVEMETHDKTRKLHCPECGRTFPFCNDCNGTGEGDYPYACDTCSGSGAKYR